MAGLMSFDVGSVSGYHFQIHTYKNICRERSGSRVNGREACADHD
jgi:hypothetical protein